MPRQTARRLLMGSSIQISTEVLVALNMAAMAVVAIYALNQGFMLSAYLWFRLRDAITVRRRHQTSIVDSAVMPPLPTVSVQLPLFNERFVAERVIAAAGALDYPHDLLHIQVLDDSTDDTTRIAQHAANLLRERGIRIDFIHRENRSGYKAGALANGLLNTQSDLIAIFDADFVPPRDLLRRIIVNAKGFADPRIGFVQTRWGHLNRDTSTLTHAQAILLDASFVIDQTVRSRLGLAMQFNGSGGVWRRSAIEAAGGWQADTLTEDLDLSYRAQLVGWRGRYLADVVCPGELPETVLAFKQQQARWARGGAQSVRKLAADIVRADKPFLYKLAALIHISGYFSTLPVLMLALVTPLLTLVTAGNGFVHPLPVWLSALGLIPILEMVFAQLFQKCTLKSLRYTPAAVLLGIGLAFSGSVSVFSGLLRRSSGEFTRTPKPTKRVLPQHAAKAHRRTISDTGLHAYTSRPDWTANVELIFGLYAAIVCLLVMLQGNWFSVVPALLYAVSFLSVASGQIIPVITMRLANHENKAGELKRKDQRL